MQAQKETPMWSDMDTQRVAEVVMSLRDELRHLAATGYRRQGRGAVVFCENLLPSPQLVAPFYLPVTDPDFDDAGPEVEEVVDVYDPKFECVVFFVTEAGGSYLFLLDLHPETAVERKPRYYH